MALFVVWIGVDDPLEPEDEDEVAVEGSGIPHDAYVSVAAGLFGQFCHKVTCHTPSSGRVTHSSYF